MNIDFRSFTITINTNSSITIATNFNAPSGPNNNNYKIVFDNNSYMYLTTSKGSQTQTISSGNVYDYIYRQIGNETSKRFTAYIIYNTSKSNSLQAKATIPEYSLSMSASSTDTNNGGQTTNYETQSRHYVNEFISGTTYLQGWSKPRIDYLISSSTGALYGNKLTLTGAITGTADLGTTSLQLGTDFAAGTYSVEAGDGRKTTTTSHTISRINWQQPSITFSLSRYNSVGRRIDWNLEGIWSYISNALQPNVNFQLTYNNNTYTLYTKNDEYYWYDGTHLYKDTTGAEIGSFDISTYSLGVPIEYPTLSQVSNVTANGQFILVDEDDYKYSISATAYLTDNIDYRVYANSLIPSGLPAIYCHKDSNSNNAVDIYGDTNINGYLRLYNQNNGLLIGDLNSSYVHFYSDQDKPFYFNRSVEINGNVYVGTKRLQFPCFMRARQTIDQTPDSGGTINVLFQAVDINDASNYLELKTDGKITVISSDVHHIKVGCTLWVERSSTSYAWCHLWVGGTDICNYMIPNKNNGEVWQSCHLSGIASVSNGTQITPSIYFNVSSPDNKVRGGTYNGSVVIDVEVLD